MATHQIFLITFLVCELVLLRYFSYAAVTGVETSFGVHKGIKCIDHEREALLQFKRGTKDHCGLLTSWGQQEDCCQWHGIRCSNLTGHVSVLHLRGMESITCLEGTVVSSLFELKHLNYMDLSSNLINHTIPKSIGSLTNLRHLNLSNAEFYGEIPPQIGNLSNLESLDLSYNSLTTKNLYWVSTLTSLREIHLSSINLATVADWFETLNKIHSLRVLYLSSCDLPPITPSSLSYINSSSSLRVVDLSFNFLNDTSIFQWLFNFSKAGHQFEYLDLSNNLLSGPLPSEFGNMHSLTYLSLSENVLSGPIPVNFSNLRSLKVLSLSYNTLEGPIPVNFSNLRSLKVLSLSCNILEGPIPVNFSNLRSLKVLSLSGNKLQGSIPDIFSNTRSLTVLSLSHNDLHGPITKVLSNLCHLKEIELSGNNITDDLSNVIETLSSGCSNTTPVLESLDLSWNRLWGSIPDKISKFSLLKKLYLGRNQLNGTISQALGKLSTLEELSISDTSLDATLNHNHFLNLSSLRLLNLANNPALLVKVKVDWIPPFQLDILSLGSCKLGPSFPKWLLTQTNLSILDISNSQISGNIPHAFWVETLSPNLEYLNVSHNMIHGMLPNLSTTFDGLQEIDLSSNYLQGSIPSFFGLYTWSLYLNNNRFTDATHLLCPNTSKSYIKLEVIDISNNLLFGELPNCWMQFEFLSNLHLENNQIFGNIPTSFGALERLSHLNLANNSLSGELPVSLENCTSLIILDLEHNLLTGYIPSNIGYVLRGLGVLNLRGNNIFGNLPLSLCQISYLQILDVAFNHINGTIPYCIHNLTAMTKGLFGDLSGYGDDGGSVRDHYREYFDSPGESIAIEWKKKERKFGESLDLIKTIDLSCNELEGKIPPGISSLKELISLDLSKNKLSGSIPTNIGQLNSLEFLDLSNNQLAGSIPTSLAQVSTLGTLDLSNNNLSGKIPLGTQLQGFDASSYRGNTLLCGMPLEECSKDKSPTSTTNGNITQHDHEYSGIDLGLYISVVLGFIFGFWGVCGTLVLKPSWRVAFFQFIDDMKDKLHVIVVVNVARAWRRT